MATEISLFNLYMVFFTLIVQALVIIVGINLRELYAARIKNAVTYLLAGIILLTFGTLVRSVPELFLANNTDWVLVEYSYYLFSFIILGLVGYNLEKGSREPIERPISKVATRFKGDKE